MHGVSQVEARGGMTGIDAVLAQQESHAHVGFEVVEIDAFLLRPGEAGIDESPDAQRHQSPDFIGDKESLLCTQ
jgi:hypothetical protein